MRTVDETQLRVPLRNFLADYDSTLLRREPFRRRFLLFLSDWIRITQIEIVLWFEFRRPAARSDTDHIDTFCLSLTFTTSRKIDSTGLEAARDTENILIRKADPEHLLVAYIATFCLDFELVIELFAISTPIVRLHASCKFRSEVTSQPGNDVAGYRQIRINP